MKKASRRDRAKAPKRFPVTGTVVQKNDWFRSFGEPPPVYWKPDEPARFGSVHQRTQTTDEKQAE